MGTNGYRSDIHSRTCTHLTFAVVPRRSSSCSSLRRFSPCFCAGLLSQAILPLSTSAAALPLQRWTCLMLRMCECYTGCCFYLVILTVVHVSTTRLREGTRGTASHQATAAAVGGRFRCGGAVVSRVSRLTHSASISESPPWRRRAAQFPHGEWGKDGLSSRLRTTGVNSAGSIARLSSTPRHAESRQQPSRCWGGEDVSIS